LNDRVLPFFEAEGIPLCPFCGSDAERAWRALSPFPQRHPRAYGNPRVVSLCGVNDQARPTTAATLRGWLTPKDSNAERPRHQFT